MRTLQSATDREAIVRRVSSLAPDDKRLWGKMSVDQMICHLNDSYESALGERATSPATGFMQRTIIKMIALKAPFQWPKGVPTRPEIEQGVGGTPPVEFEKDRAKLLGLVDRFCRDAGGASVQHPFFGPMTRADWMRWGYLHADHHLRQFGR